MFLNAISKNPIDRSFNKVILFSLKNIDNHLKYELENLGSQCCICYDTDTLKKLIKNEAYQCVIIDTIENLSLVNKIVCKGNNSYPKIIYCPSSYNQITQEIIFKYNIVDYFEQEEDISHLAKNINKLLHALIINKQRSVLIIDDSNLLETTVKKQLQLKNYDVVLIKSPQKGVELLKENSFDLLLLNILHPKHSCESIIEHVRKEFNNDMIPILLLDEHCDQKKLMKLYKKGASYIQQKTNSYEALMLNIDYWVEYHQNIKKLIKNQHLLQEYKDTVDASNIVSKSDPKGTITYVNQQFCEISGYSKDELIGSPHNIIRHSDMPASAFQNMWKTIKSKNIWKGVVKNLSKDGSAYYVDTTIKPIVDNSGKIIEYIGVRKNITELEEFRQQLENELNVKEENLQEMIRRSREYHKAMDESTILARTDLDGKITYINREFTLALGYTVEDIIGQNHSIMKHPDTPNVIIQNLWDTILDGKTWKGMIKNKNIHGETVWLDTVIVPIKNMKEEVVEYLTIRHNVSEIIQLNEEIETTQGELVYTLGAAVETRSKETGNHIKRVAHYSKELALLYGLDSKEAEILYQASPLHDIGKLGIPDHILKKPAQHTPQEWEIMKTHSELGYNILKNSTRPILKAASIVAYEHHEKWDGSGYPQGLSKEDIHIYGRITAIADVFDALGSDRVYKKAWSDKAIFQLLHNESGKHFDPALIQLFFDNLDRFLEIRERFVDNLNS